MENTKINKQKFFALYYGQPVFFVNQEEYSNEIDVKTPFSSMNHRLNWSALLKPLSSITDEDAIEVAKIIGYSDGREESISYLNSQCKNLIRDYDVFWLFNLYNVDAKKCLEVIDYLRSKVYALPWTGLSVEQLLEYGWIKLKTE